MATCLIVDDDPAQRALTRMIVEGTGRFRHIWEADDGPHSIAKARTSQPDLVLLDLNMPVMDGVQALPRLLRAAPWSTVVICSSEQNPARRASAQQAGAHGFIDKSLSVDQFGDAVTAIHLRSRPRVPQAKVGLQAAEASASA